jgi:hypothetical protein
MKVLNRFMLNMLVLLDQLGNTLTGGSPNETISERAAKARNNKKAWGCVLCRLLDCIQKDHCNNALKSTIGDDAIIPDGK